MNIRLTVLTALFAALISAGAYIIIPIGPVPITLQTLFILTAGILGGRKIGLSAVVIYLIAGAVGLPVFSGGTGSAAHFFSPTGGYLVAAIPAVLVCGFFSEIGQKIRIAGSKGPVDNEKTTGSSISIRKIILGTFLILVGAILGSLIFYAVGVPWLKVVLEMNWENAFKAGMLPFLIGDAVKVIAAVSLGTLFGGRISNFLQTGASDEPA